MRFRNFEIERTDIPYCVRKEETFGSNLMSSSDTYYEAVNRRVKKDYIEKLFFTI